MSEVAVFMIVNLVIDNESEYRKYEKGFFPILKKFGGELVTFDDSHENFEGDSPLEGRVINFIKPNMVTAGNGFKFPSEELAKQWYNDKAYQALSEFRRAGTTLKNLTMVHGLPPRP